VKTNPASVAYRFSVQPKAKRRIVLVAEFSIHPIGMGTSVGRYVKAAVRAMSRIPGLTVDVAPMSSVLEAESIGTILEAVEFSHQIGRASCRESVVLGGHGGGIKKIVW